MAQSVTSGSELNSYRGDANLAGGNADTGYAKIDFSPLETYALKKYENNKIDFEQQQKDKAKLEQEFMNPDLNVFLDKPLADQISPKLTRFKELAKENLQMKPNSDKWYEFHTLYNDILKDNSKAKVVQTKKEEARAAAAASGDPHEKERLTAYADKLDKYKIGDEVPVYDKYFGYDDKAVPKPEVAKYTVQRPTADGKGIETVEKTVNNSRGLMDKYNQLQYTNPEASKTWQDLAHTAIEGGTVDQLNQARLQNLNQTKALGLSDFNAKYKKSFDTYKKKNPAKTFNDFIAENGLQAEHDLAAGDKGLEYLNQDIQFIPLEQGQKELTGFTYAIDPATGKYGRLSIPDIQVAAIHGATINPPGEKEKILKSELSIKPDDEFKAKEARALNDADNATSRANNRASVGATNYGNELEMVAKGFKKDGKGGWIPPVGGIAAGANGEVPYWSNTLAPELEKLKGIDVVLKKGTGYFGKDTTGPMPADYSGDVVIPKDKTSAGLDVALFETNDKYGKKRSINKSSVVKIRYENGVAKAIVIDDVPYDQKDIDSKATRMNNKSMSGKTDSPIFEKGQAPAGSSDSTSLRQKYGY